MTARAARASCCVLLALALLSASVPPASSAVLREHEEGRALSPLGLPLGALTSRVTSRGAAGGAGEGRAERLPLPSAQDIDTIRKVAQLLIMLGEQVIPSILGDAAPVATQAQCCPPAPPAQPSPAPAPAAAAVDDE